MMVLCNQCPYCSSLFSSPGVAHTHALRSAHKGKRITDSARTVHEIAPPPTMPIHCPICCEEFHTVAIYHKHAVLCHLPAIQHISFDLPRDVPAPSRSSEELQQRILESWRRTSIGSQQPATRSRGRGRGIGRTSTATTAATNTAGRDGHTPRQAQSRAGSTQATERARASKEGGRPAHLTSHGQEAAHQGGRTTPHSALKTYKYG